MKVKTRLLSLFFCLSLAAPPLYADIKVGTVFFDPPFVMSVGEGFDIDLIRVICKRMQEKCQIIPMSFHKLFPALNAGKIDIAIGSISIAPYRLTNYIFSLPYMLSKSQFLTLQNSTVKSVTDLTGEKIGVIRADEEGGVSYNYLLQNFTNQFQIIQYNDLEDIITALSNGEIAAAFLHKPTANYWEQNGGNQFRTLGSSMVVGDGIAIMALPGNTALIQRINQQLQEMEKDNSYLNVYKTYFPNQ